MDRTRWSALILTATCTGFGLWPSGAEALGPAALARAERPPARPREAVDLILQSVRVSETKADGSSWDVDEGKPDLQVTIKNQRTGKTLTTEVAKDSFVAKFPADLAALEVTEGDVLEIRVIDDDVAADDLVGEAEKAITSDMLEKRRLNWSFAQVMELRLEMRPRD